MRHLVHWKASPMPREMAKTALALVEATGRWIEEEKKAGRLVEIWTYTAGGEGIALWEVDSNDALFKKLIECPYPCDFTVTPLTDWKLSNETYKDFWKKMAGK